MQKIKGSYILQLSAWMIFASLLFALIAGLVLFASLTGRLKRLANAMDAFRSSTDHQPIALPSPIVTPPITITRAPSHRASP